MQIEMLDTEGAALPFQPRSFRDFMLFEKHAIDAARGYVKRFMPLAYQVSRVWESCTGSTFPPFKPSGLWYRQPIYYMGNALTFVPGGSDVSIPSYTTAFDYELELGFFLEKPLLNATPHEAICAIGGFVVLCDFSARDLQRDEMRSGFGPQKSKHFLNSMSKEVAPPYLIVPRLDRLAATVEINGSTVLRTSTADMRFTIGEALAHASRGEQLFPGELFGTGTLPGGCGMENGHWLKTGDRLKLSIEHVGQIEHRVL